MAATPKSLLRGRTQPQFDFDWGVRGWAFTHQAAMPRVAARARRLYEAIGAHDAQRLDTLLAIEAKAGEL